MKTLFTILALLALAVTPQIFAARKVVLDARIEEALETFHETTSAGAKLEKKAKGMLVFPTVGKAGFWLGGAYGEGALIIDGKTAQYYRTTTASIGFQLGAQRRAEIILFLTDDALKRFRNSEGWEIGIDGSVAIANIGAGGEIDTKTLNGPVVAFILNNKGLMYNLSLEGSKVSKIDKKD